MCVLELLGKQVNRPNIQSRDHFFNGSDLVVAFPSMQATF